MKIAINILYAKRGGGIHSMIGLMHALESVDNENDYLIFMHSGQKDIINLVPPRFKKNIIPLNLNNILSRLLVEQLLLPLYLYKYKADWFYSGGNITIFFAPCKTILLIENSSPYSFIKLERSKYEIIKNIMVQVLCYLSSLKATKIRFISKNSCTLICNNYNIPIEKSFVLPHGFESRESYITDEGGDEIILPSRYILCVSDIYPHKNMHNLLEAFDIFVEEFKYDGKLVIIGKHTYYNYDKYFKSIQKRRDGLKNGCKIVFQGWVEHANLYRFYKNADAFVYPSIEETFGLPIIEAMAFNIPVVVSDCSKLKGKYFNPFKEICFDAASYFNPLDPKDMAQAIYRVIYDKEYKQKLLRKAAKQIQRYNYTNIAELFIKELKR